MEGKEVDTSDIFDERPDEVHLPAGYVSVDTETNILGYAGDIPYGYAQANTMSELELILHPKGNFANELLIRIIYTSISTTKLLQCS